MNRRNFVKFASAFSLAASLLEQEADAQSPAIPPQQAPQSDPPPQPPQQDAVPPEPPAASEAPFSEEWLRARAQELSRQPFAQLELKLPSELADLNQQTYQSIEFKPEAAVWKDEPINFALRFFHSGFQYKTPVLINLIENDVARPFFYSPLLFNFKAPLAAPPADSQAGFSGVEVQTLLGGPAAKEPFLIFHGASFFRAIGSGQAFGASSRGVSLNTAQPVGEEFPFFREFWIRKPATGERWIVIHALLDGPSVTGAYKFTVEAGRTTAIDVECTLFPRTPLAHVGIASLTSMFFFGSADPTRMDDYRPNVHSSDGLQIWNGAGEWIWRPLINSERLQYSVFLDRSPRGFGLFQRKRAFSDFEDIDARFGERPSVWVEPLGDWGEGAVDLIEVPTQSEIYDNIIAFWRPKAPLDATASHTYRYRLHWGWDPPLRSTGAYVARTRVGASRNGRARLFVIDFVSGGSCDECNLLPFTADVRAGDGQIRNVAVRGNPATRGQRVSFEFEPGGADQTDLRCELQQNGQGVSETWIYRWTG